MDHKANIKRSNQHDIHNYTVTHAMNNQYTLVEQLPSNKAICT